MKNKNTKRVLRNKVAVLIGLFLVFCVIETAQAATGINEQINFQGKVVNTDGTNVSTASYNFLFCIYTTASPVTPCTSGADNDAVWRESKSITVTDGIFQTNLGDVTTLPGSVDFNTDNIYLGINFNSNGQMAPLVRFTTAPYAMNAGTVGGLGTSGLIVQAATANQTVTSSQTAGTVFGVTDTTGLSAAIKGLSVTLSGSGAYDQTGLEFNLSGASGTNLNDIVGSGSTWKVSTIGVATLASLTVDDITLNANTISSAGASSLSITPTAGQAILLDGTISIDAGVVTGITSLGVTGTRVTTSFFTDLTVTNSIAGSVTGNAGTVTGFTPASGSLTLAGADALTLTTTADSNVTLPTTGTLATLAGSEILSTKTLTAPKFVDLGFIADANGNEILVLDTVATAVPYLQLSNNSTGLNPVITGAGEANTGIDFAASGTGTFRFIGNASQAGEIRLFEDTTDGTNYTAFKVGIQSADLTYTLPTAYPAVTGYVLSATDAGVMSWVASGGGGMAIGGSITSATLGSVLFADTAGVLAQDNTNFFWDNTNKRLGIGDATPDGRIDFDLTSTATTGAAEYGANFTVSDTGVVTTGSDAIWGISNNVTHTGATGGTISTYGNYTILATDNAGSGTSTAYGSYIDTGLGGNTADTVYGSVIYTWAAAGSTAYGLYVDAGTGAGTEYAAAFMNGNVGIGTATPTKTLDVTGTLDVSGQAYVGEYLSFTANDNVRIIGSSSEFMSFYTNGGERVRIDSTGKVGIGDTTPDGKLDFDLTSTATTGASEYGANFTVSDTGVVTTGTDTTYGDALTLTRTGATGGVINTYGRYTNLTADSAGAGTATAYGTYTYVQGNGGDLADTSYAGYNKTVTSAGGISYGLYSESKQLSSSATQTNYGLYATVTGTGNGGGTSYGAYVDNSAVNYIYDSNTKYGLYLNSTGSFTGSAGAANINYALYIAAATGADTNYSFYNASSADSYFTGNVGIGDSTPAALFTVGNGDLFQVNTGGALTLAGVLTANGGITLAGSQSFSASALAYMDLGAITHSTTANQGLRLPNAASATPSNPTSGEGYLAWDAGGNQVIYYNGSAWATFSAGGGYNLIKDETVSLTARTTLAFFGAGVNCADSGSQTECTINGGAAPSDTLQNAYDAGSAGNQTVTLDATQDSIIVSNPASSGSDSTFVLKVEQLNTGIATDGLYVDNRGTGNGLRVDDSSGDTTPFIIDGDGRVGIGTASISGSASTERLLQVGSEVTRGNLATYGEIISKGLNRHTALTNIKDIYVYDTTGDSDGGRWIDWATTDNLSWYSEALDDGPNDPCNIASDDRCYNNAFPRKAILVVTIDALYIFDAATNDMWMKFSQNASGYALGADTNNNPSSVYALNGVVYVGANGTSAGGLYAIDFVNDRMWNYNGTNRSAADVGISGRNAAVTYNVDPNTKLEISPTGTQAEWERVNDVSAVVMSRTQSAVTALGSATNTNPGYGKVFIALATDSGVTVINPSGLVLNQYSDVAGDDYTAVALTSRGFLYALNTTQDQLERWDTIDTDKASEVAGTYNRKWDETIATGPALASSAFNIIAGAPDNLEVAERASNNLNTEDVVYVGHSLGMAELHEHTTQAFGWVKYYDATRQTPMMMLAGINDMVLPMDDASGTQAQDLAIANTDMAIKGTPTLGVNGVQGKAINFDNTDDFLCSDANQDNTCDVDTALNMSTVGWTISLWFKHSTTAPAAGADTIFEKCVTTTPAKATGCVIAYMTTTGTIVVANDDDATYTRPDEGAQSYDITATSTYAYNDNQWHNLIITRTNANDVDSWIDGQGMSLSTATGNTLTLDGSQIVTIGASCSFTAGAACTTTTNFWDGQIDDVQYMVGTTTQATMTQLYVRRYFNVERPRASKKTITVADATSATSTSLTDTGEAWYVNEFAGQIVEITGSGDADCVGVTRRISSNTATALTFTPAVPGACTMDTSADFQVDPEKLYGASSSVSGIGITGETPLGEARQLCVGTNSSTDTGGVTCYNHQDGPSIVADVYHSQSSHTDDNGTDWAGTDYDDMIAIDLSSRTLVMASEGHFTSRTEDVRLGQGLEYISNQLYAIRQEIVLDGITAVGSMGSEIGFTGGADLAEWYYSGETLEAGEVVAIDSSFESGVKKSSGAYQRDAIGIVATTPGLILGTEAENSYPIALVGRVPVKVTNENGQIYAGDRVTTSSRPGYGMFASQAGRVIGQALSDAVDWTVCEGEDPMNRDAKLCTTVLVFVNLADYSGVPVELGMSRMSPDSAADRSVGTGLESDSSDEALATEGATVRLASAEPTREEKILAYLKKIRDEQAASGASSSEIFTGRVSASTEIITPTLFADQIFAKSIRADSIEGLQIWTDQISSLSEKYAGLTATATAPGSDGANPQATTEQKTLAIAMKDLATDSIIVQLDGSILGKLSVAGALRIGGNAQFDGETIFAKLATFLGDTIFKGKTVFEKAPTFGSNTAGFAIIAEGQWSVDVAFDEAYAKQPIVSVSITSDESPLTEDAKKDVELAKDVAAVEADFASVYFDGDIKYIVTKKSNQGFTIVLNKPAPRELQFSWVAIAVTDAKVSRSKEDVPVVTPTIPDETPTILPGEVPAAVPTTENIQGENTLPVEVSPPVEPVAPVTDISIETNASVTGVFGQSVDDASQPLTP